MADHYLDRDVPLSQSQIWALNRHYYATRGPDAWASGETPSLVTTNAAMARAVAHVILGFLRDCAAGRMGPLDPDAPVDVVEVGLGTGRLAWMVIRRLEALVAEEDAPLPRWRYVATDAVEPNLAAFAARPQLAPRVADGRVVVAPIDLEAPGALTWPDAGRNPSFLLATYVLDSLPPDGFRVEDGAVEAILTSLRVTDGTPVEQLDTAVLEVRPAPAADPYPDDPELTALLRAHAAAVGARSFLFPVTAVRALRRLLDAAGGRMMMLLVDQGYNDVRDLEAAPLARHTSVSAMVDFVALGRWASLRGGEAWQTPDRSRPLLMCALTFGAAAPLGWTRRAFRDHLVEGGPIDVHRILDATHDQVPFDPEALLALLRISACDPTLFFRIAETLEACAARASGPALRGLLAAMDEVHANHLPVEPHRDVPFNLGRVYAQLGLLDRSLACFLESEATWGPHPATHQNIGVVLEAMGRHAEAAARLALADGSD